MRAIILLVLAGGFEQTFGFEQNIFSLLIQTQMSRPNKSSILWNVVDPDDPYDIKKSMIAKLPDHPSQPMGNHLELVCLLQAAEIERLSDYLTEINSKYREMERRELDRHSYEVQIKELAERNISLTNLQKENERLKDFIRRQSAELEELQKKNMISINFETLQAKYEGLLNELRIARNQNQGAEKTISRLNVEIGEWRARWEKGEQQRSAFASQFEIQLREKLNIEVKAVRERAEERAEKLQMEVRQLKELVDSKNHEIQTLTSQRQQFVREIRMLEEKNRNKGNIQEAINQKNREIQRLNGLIAEKNAKFEQSMASNQRIGGELNILDERYRNLEKEREKLVIKIKELEVFKSRSESFEKLQEKVAMMSMEIERLNGLNAVRARECADANGEIERLKFQLRNNQNAREQLQRERQRITKLESEIQILRASESRTRIQADELQRVRSTLNSKNEEIYLLQQKVNISQINSVEFANLAKERSRLDQQLQLSLQKIQNMKIALNANQANAMDLAKLAKDKSSLQQELQASKAELRNYKTITESQISTLKSQNARYRQQLEHNSVTRGEYEKYKIETDRLRAEIERIRGESMNIRKIFEQEKSHTIKLENQRNSLLSENQNMLNELLHLKKEIENFKILIKSFDQKERLLQSREYQLMTLQRNFNIMKAEFEDLIAQKEKLEATVESIYNEIERLHQVLEIKVTQNQKFLKDISQYEEKCRFYQSKLDNTANEREYYEKELTRLRGELDNSSKMTNQANRDLMNRLNEALMEKEKNDKLIIQKERLINEYSKEKDILEKKLIEIQRQFALRISVQEQLKKEKEQYRLEKQKYYEEIRTKQSTIYQLQTVIRQRETIIRQKELIIKEKDNNYRESDGKVKVWESRVAEWESRLRDAERGIQIREEESEKYRKENERLNIQIQRFSQQLQEIARQRQTVINENNQLKRRIEQLSKDQKNKAVEEQLRNQLRTAEEALFRERKEMESIRSQSRSFEQSLNRQTRELQTVRETIREYQMKIVHIENTQTRVLQDRIKEYETKLPQRQNLVIVLQRQIKQMQAQLESVVARDKEALSNLHKYEEKISLLSVEIERLNTKLEEKSRDIRDKEGIIAGLNSRLNQPDFELQDRIKQSQSKLVFYASEIEKLKKIIYQRQTDINQKNNSIQALAIKINSNTASQDSQAISRYKIEITNLQTALQEFQNINMHTIAERDQLFKVSHELKDQLDDQAFKFKDLEGQLRGELNYRLEENRRFGEELGQLKKRQQTYLMKIEEYERIASRGQEKQLRIRLTQLQGQLQGLRNENANLGQQVNHLLALNQQLSIKIGESSNYSRDEVNRLTIMLRQSTQQKELQIGQWDLKYNSLYSAYEQLYNNYQITKEEYEKAFIRIKDYERMTIQIQENYQSIAVTLRNKQQEIYDLKMRFKAEGDLYEKNLILSKEIDRLTELNRKYVQDVKQLRMSLSDNTSLHKRIQQQLALLVLLFAEIESLRSRLTHSQKQCEQVRRSSLVPCRVDKSRQNRL